MAKLMFPAAEDIRALMDSEGRLALRVTPNAKAEAVSIEDGMLRIRVTVVPEDGKANKAVISLLAKALGVSKSAIEIVRGETARDKVVRVRLGN